MHRLALVLILVAGVDAAGAQPSADRSRWLATHTSPIRSFAFDDTNYTDLEPIARAIGDRRIVLLGEQSHGDGTTFEAKARLIRFLHERHGFDLLVFESGLYDCRRTWADARAGLSLADSASNCMFELWSNSAQLRPLLAYMDREKHGPRPLALAGMDFQPSGRRAREMVPDLERFLTAQPDTSGNGELLGALHASYGRLVAGARPTADTTPLVRAREAAARFATRPLADVRALGELGEAPFWRRTVANAVGVMTMMSGMRRGMTADVMNPRDASHARFSPMVASRDPSARLVVWGASSHFVRDRTGIDGDPAPLMVPAGHVVASRLPGEVYGVMFLAAEGQFGTARSAGSPRAPVDPPDPTTLDGLFAATDIERGFLDLRRLPAGGAWLDAPLTARPLGYAPMTTTWPKHFDGVVFIRRMSPSVPVVTGSAR